MKIAFLLVVISLLFIGAIFTYVGFFAKGLNGTQALSSLALGIGCLSMSCVILLLTEINEKIQQSKP